MYHLAKDLGRSITCKSVESWSSRSSYQHRRLVLLRLSDHLSSVAVDSRPTAPIHELVVRHVWRDHDIGIHLLHRVGEKDLQRWVGQTPSLLSLILIPDRSNHPLSERKRILNRGARRPHGQEAHGARRLQFIIARFRWHKQLLQEISVQVIDFSNSKSFPRQHLV